MYGTHITYRLRVIWPPDIRLAARKGEVPGCIVTSPPLSTHHLPQRFPNPLTMIGTSIIISPSERGERGSHWFKRSEVSRWMADKREGVEKRGYILLSDMSWDKRINITEGKYCERIWGSFPKPNHGNVISRWVKGRNKWLRRKGTEAGWGEKYSNVSNKVWMGMRVVLFNASIEYEGIKELKPELLKDHQSHCKTPNNPFVLWGDYEEQRVPERPNHMAKI